MKGGTKNAYIFEVQVLNMVWEFGTKNLGVFKTFSLFVLQVELKKDLTAKKCVSRVLPYIQKKC